MGGWREILWVCRVVIVTFAGKWRWSTDIWRRSHWRVVASRVAPWDAPNETVELILTGTH